MAIKLYYKISFLLVIAKKYTLKIRFRGETENESIAKELKLSRGQKCRPVSGAVCGLMWFSDSAHYTDQCGSIRERQHGGSFLPTIAQFKHS